MAKTSKKKNPKKSWKKFEKETSFQYFDRIITYNRLQVIIGFLSLLVACIMLHFALKGPTEEEKVRQEIDNMISSFENKASRDGISANNDTIEYMTLLREYDLAVLDYMQFWKSVEKDVLDVESSDSPSEIAKVIKSEILRRQELSDKAIKVNILIGKLKIYQYLTDSINCSKLSEIKQIKINKSLKELCYKDSINTISIVEWLDKGISNYKNKQDCKIELNKAIQIINDSKYDIGWLNVHKNMMDFFIEAYDLFEMSKRHYNQVPPYRDLDADIKKAYKDSSQHYLELIRSVVISDALNKLE